jgi:hypothetical protein
LLDSPDERLGTSSERVLPPEILSSGIHLRYNAKSIPNKVF